MSTHHALLRKVMALCAVAAAVLLSISGGRAQERGTQSGAAAPTRVQVEYVQVKPDRADAYRELTRNERLPAMKKAGTAWFWTFTTGPVGQSLTGFHVMPLPNYAELDKGNPLRRAMGDAWLDAFNAKLTTMILSRRRVVRTLNVDASIISNAATPPGLVLVQDVQVLPGKQREVLALVKSNFLPAYRKAGVKDFWVYATNMGGPSVLSVVRPIANYAELDQPGLLARAGLSQQARDELNARRDAISTLVEANVLAYQADISYGMPAPVK